MRITASTMTPRITRVVEFIDSSPPSRKTLSSGGGTRIDSESWSGACGYPLRELIWRLQQEPIADLRTNHGKATSGPFMGRDVLILTTKGARSGETRETPLVYTRDGNHYVIVASKGGAPTHPNWYHNLRKHPEVTVEVGHA